MKYKVGDIVKLVEPPEDGKVVPVYNQIKGIDRNWKWDDEHQCVVGIKAIVIIADANDGTYSIRFLERVPEHVRIVRWVVES